MKKGISLIVLVITIIVIIILAGAVILSLATNNPIAQANTATRSSDADAVQSALSMYLGRIMAEYQGAVQIGVTGVTPMTGNTITINAAGVGGNPLYKNPTTGAIKPYATAADATTDGFTQALRITNTDLGLASWPAYAGYTLNVDQNGYVTWTQP